MEKLICDTGLSNTKKSPYYAQATSIPTKPGCWNYLIVEIIERETSTVIGSYKRNYSSLFRTFHPFELHNKWYALYSPDYTATRIMSLPDCTDIGGEKSDEFGFCPTDFFVPTLQYIQTNHWNNCPQYKDNNHKPDYSKPCICHFMHHQNCPLNASHPKIVNGGYEWDKCICKEDYDKFRNWHYESKYAERIHGFVAGCIWGDDSSYKIQYLDLSQADKGILKREERFGYIELPEKIHLDDAICLEYENESYYLKIATEKYYEL